MKRVLACVGLLAAFAALSGCYYDPGYSYVRSSSSSGDAYYGEGGGVYYAQPAYTSGYYDGYYGSGYYGGYAPGVSIGVSSGWYGRSNGYRHVDRDYRHDRHDRDDHRRRDGDHRDRDRRGGDHQDRGRDRPRPAARLVRTPSSAGRDQPRSFPHGRERRHGDEPDHRR